MIDIILTSHLQSEVCKINLTHNLDGLILPIKEETKFWLTQAIPDESTSPIKVTAHETMLHVIAGVTSRIFVGLPRSREKKWLATAVNYTLDVFRVSTALRTYPPFLRSFVAPWLDSTNRLRVHVKTAKDCFGSIFAQRLALPDGEREANDMFQWMVDSASGADRNPEVLVRKMLFLTLAAIHTSTMSVTHALLDLCTYPEYVEPLRGEIHEIVGTHGWTLASINKLKLLDSFLKESQRVNHPGLLSFNRRVMKSLQLSDGTEIPSGSFICMATNSIAHDPENYPNPNQFDGFRFYKKRLSSQMDANLHQFASTGPNSLAFGHGKFACPGRFFAAAQIKVIIATILFQYDISFPDGQSARPENIFSGESIGPDRSQSVVFKRRSRIEC
ncbi:cytochrome P450 [Biscogniauxia marginata]|nr:cytochrome P450 [Biscogniauxia marginata]